MDANLLFDVVMLISSLIFGGISGAIVGYAVVNIRLDALLTEWKTSKNAYMEQLSAKGVSSRSEDAEQMEGAMIEAVQIFQSKEIPQESKMQAIMALLPKYPRVGRKLALKLGLRI